MPSCPEAVRVPCVPGALLSVNEMSLSACPALPMALAAKVFVRVTVSWPALVVKSALADSDPSELDPLPVKVIAVAPAVEIPESTPSAAAAKPSFKLVSLNDIFVPYTVVILTKSLAKRVPNRKINNLNELGQSGCKGFRRAMAAFLRQGRGEIASILRRFDRSGTRRCAPRPGRDR